MECPALVCMSANGYRMSGSVPGVKRHVKAVHGLALYEETTWPDIHGEVHGTNLFAAPRPGSLFAMSINDLRREAKRRGVYPLGKSRKALAVELSNKEIEGRKAQPESDPPPS